MIKDLLTGIDGESYDLGRVSWVFTTTAIIALAVYEIYHAIPVSISDFGIALATNTTGHGVAIGMKAKTEPQGD